MTIRRKQACARGGGIARINNALAYRAFLSRAEGKTHRAHRAYLINRAALLRRAALACRARRRARRCWRKRWRAENIAQHLCTCAPPRRTFTCTRTPRCRSVKTPPYQEISFRAYMDRFLLPQNSRYLSRARLFCATRSTSGSNISAAHAHGGGGMAKTTRAQRAHHDAPPRYYLGTRKAGHSE